MKFACVLLLALAVSQGSAAPLITSSLEAALRNGNTADIMVIMRADAQTVLDTIEAQTFVNANTKVTTMVDQLKQFTSQSQQEVLSILSKLKTQRVTGFWVVNRISVDGASQEVIDALKERSDILEIRLAKVFAVPTTTVGDAKVLEWGVSDIDAPAVWATGNTGEGVVVSNIDTGVRVTHQDVAVNYRSSYGWFDPYSGTATPNDQNGHGSHTMGTIAGQSGTGVAPGAQWVACKGCSTSSCTEPALIGCGQWSVCPTLPDGTAPNCDMRPNVSSNSWGGGNEDTFYDGVINAMNAAGVIPVFAIGNSGPGCRTANSPGDRPNVISVGATDPNHAVASFSSHGPTARTGVVKPEVSAPGVNVRSIGHLSDVAYATLSGTSMATPHVAGSVALLLSKNPAATREQLADALQKTALRPALGTIVCTGGIDDPNNPWPNNSFGWGKIIVSAAVEAL